MQNRYLKPNLIVSIIGYVIIMFLGSSVILLGITFIASLVTNVSYLDIMNALVEKSADENINKVSVIIYAITNFISYLLLFIIVTFYMRNHLKEDFNKSKEKVLKTILLMIICSVLFYFFTVFIDYLISKYSDVGESQNQINIIDMILNGSAILTFISVVIFAPLVEELIFRKAIFKLLEKYQVLAFIVSTVIFTLLHMSTGDGGIKEWILICLPYFVSALGLTTIYLVSKKNIWVSTFVHMANNLLAFIFIIINR